MDLNENRPNMERYIVPAFARGLTLMELLARYPHGLNMGQMTELNLPSATLFRMLSTLVALGYAIKNDDNRYILSNKLLSVANQAIDNRSLIMCAEEFMRKLRDFSGESVTLAIFHGNSGVIIHQILSNQAVKVMVEIGHNFPLHSAAPAKAMLAFSSANRREELLKTIDYKKFTATTITNEMAFKKELELIAKEKVAYDRGEELEDLFCIAAPILNYKGEAIAAISLNGPVSRFNSEKIENLTPKVKDISEQISKNFIN